MQEIKRKYKGGQVMKVFLLIYVASFLIINWTDVSWIFNYREMSGLVSDFFNPYPSIDVQAVSQYFHSNNSNKNTGQNQINSQQVKSIYVDKQNSIEIPKISIFAPIVFSTSQEKKDLENDLNRGVVYYPGSVYPGASGQAVILGHSAPPGWPKTKYEWVFSDLEELSAGDSILVNYNHRQYRYVVRQKTIIEKGEDAPVYSTSQNAGSLNLVSCWPPGKDYQRIAVLAELVDND